MAKVIVSSKLSFTYGESARYFQISELNNKILSFDNHEIDKINIGNQIVIKRTYDKTGILKND